MVGAGAGGLSAAIGLAARGHDVTLFERSSSLGGKIRTVNLGGHSIDVGPTVLTMPWVFERLFSDAGRTFANYIKLEPLECIARHAWPRGQALDLWHDIERSQDAIGHAFGTHDAKAYAQFIAYAKKIYELTQERFIHSPKPTVPATVAAMLKLGLREAAKIDAGRTMIQALKSCFQAPELQQLFARYATYVGSDPYRAPATLNVIAYVEQLGVYRVEGGMVALADAMVRLAKELGVIFVTECGVRSLTVKGRAIDRVNLDNGESLAIDGVVYAGDVHALHPQPSQMEISSNRSTFLKEKRSWSAFTLALSAEVDGYDLDHHTVFFSNDYAAEFEQLRAGHYIEQPTIYICASQRTRVQRHSSEPLFAVINAPARPETGIDANAYAGQQLQRLIQYGLRLKVEQLHIETPADFASRYPGSAGSIYGRITDNAFSMFKRAANRHPRIVNLGLCGGSVHPGAGVPMATLSGQLAIESLNDIL